MRQSKPPLQRTGLRPAADRQGVRQTVNMGINIRLESESGETLAEVLDPYGRTKAPLPSYSDSDSYCLRFVDRYGDAVFNQLQLPLLVSEVRRRHEGLRDRAIMEHVFVSCSLQDMIRVHVMRGNPLDNYHEHVAIQLNDTHPSISVAEFMRLLVDDHGMDWDTAWDITQKTFAYTNHTLLPEALEKWPVSMFRSLLPRHLEIIYEINLRFLDDMRKSFPGDEGRIARLSLIDESGERFVRMAHLACVGSHAVNGVAALHTELLKSTVLRDFYEIWPEKFLNATNGVTPRRWTVLSNPKLAGPITGKIGDSWIKHMEELRLPRRHPE